MLREAIGERITEKTSSAKHKLLKEYKNTKNVMGSWSHDTKTNTSQKLKNVRSKIDNFSLTRRQKVRRSYSVGDEEEPHDVLENNEMLNSLKFGSPLNNRSYNLEQASTYETPKSLNRRSSGDLPSYDDVVKEQEFLKRNTNLTQSLYSIIQKPNNLDRDRKTLNTISSESSGDELESAPPSIPAPELPEQIYGRIKKLPSSDYENAPMIPLRKPPPPPMTAKNSKALDVDSDKATIGGSLSDKSADFTPTRKSLNISEVTDRSESWQYVDNISHDTVESMESNEPIYTNDENERVGATMEPMYDKMFEAKSTLLTPLKIGKAESSERKSATLTRDILNEFDPLSRESFDAFMMTKMNHLSLLETLLSEETYGTVEDDYTAVDRAQIEESSSVESGDVPMPPERNDSLVVVKEEERIEQRPAPKAPKRGKKPVERVQSVIIHQNLRLKDSVENLAEPFLAQYGDEPSTSGVVDLSRPKPAKSNWFVENESDKFVKNNLDNPNNFAHAPTDKLAKTIPQLTKMNNLTANREHLPTYEESKNDEIVSIGAVEKQPDTPAKSRTSFFTLGLLGRHNVKETPKDPKDFIPHPPFSEDSHHAADKGVLFKLPSGVIEDILKELNPRFVDVKKRQFKAYSDSDFKMLKEHLDLSHMTSVQYLINHKFTDFKTDSGRQIYCFEINLAVPKNAAVTGNPMLDNKGSPVKTQRVTYVYGIHSKNEK